MNANSGDRLTELHAFIESSDNELTQILDSLGWTREGLRETKDDKFLCRHDRTHKMKSSKLACHEVKCRLQQEGYDKDDQVGAISTKFCYENASSVHSIHMDAELQDQIIKSTSSCTGSSLSNVKEVPLTLERTQATITAAERLAIYDYCVEKAKAARKLVKISDEELMFLSADSQAGKEDADGSGQTYIERMAEMRDYKRRRQSYRAKNVHTTKKTQTEIMREVIANQMEILEQMWEDNKEKIVKQELPSNVGESVSKNDSQTRIREDTEGQERSRSHYSSRESSPKHKKKRHRSRSRSRESERRHSKKHHKKHKSHEKSRHRDRD